MESIKTPIDVTIEAGKTYWWCACGRSQNQPFCDGSHKGATHSPLRYQPIESGTMRFCVCKQTAAPPLCDGVHPSCALAAKETI
jgi:CDGSH iron-sulfur domain-containing protein 3